MEIKHHYIEQGEGFPLILLHGNGEDAGYFVHQMEPFSKHFRVMAIDTRGHGQTPRGSAPFTIRQFAEDLLEFMDQQSIEKAHVLGFSDGGNIAMVFALAHPERVEKLILDGANLDASGVKRSTQIPIEIGYRIAKFFARKSPEAKKKAELLGLMVNDPNVKPEELAQIKCPTLVVAGTKDMIKEGHTRLIARSIPGAELVIIPGDHFVANKNPDAFNKAVLSFLSPMNSNYIIRHERQDEYHQVENLVREAFWNVYRPGCLEHYVLHCLRDDPAFIPELDFVMEEEGKLIGQCMYMHATIQSDDGRSIPILTMGPIGVHPDHKRQGYGKALLDYSLSEAARMGFGAVCFEGNIDFYGKSGFTYASDFGIRYHGLPEGEDASFFLCKELIPGYLDGVTGVYATPSGYFVDEQACEVFDQAFPPKEKLRLPGQLW